MWKKRYYSFVSACRTAFLFGACLTLVGFANTAGAQDEGTMLVVHNPGDAEVDTPLLLMLEELGYSLATVDDDNVRTEVDPTTVADNYVGVFISESITSGNVEGHFNGVSIPVVNAESYTYDDMLWNTGTGADVDMGAPSGFTSLQVVNPMHPIASGLGDFQYQVYEQETDPVSGNATSIMWGRALPMADVVATMPGNEERATIFVYEPGDTLRDGSEVLARKVGIFPHRTGSAHLTEIGMHLVRNSVLYAMGREDEITELTAWDPPTFLFIGNPENTAEDQRYLELLADTLGYGVFQVPDSETMTLDSLEVLETYAGIFVSESAGSGNVAAKFKGYDMPIVNAETFTYDDMQWAATFAIDADVGFTPVGMFNEIRIPEGVDHPIIQGLADVHVQIFEGDGQIGFVNPVPNAHIIASLPENGDFEGAQATLFTLSEGDTLADAAIVPAKRASWMVHREGSAALTDAGEKLFINTVAWTMTRPMQYRSLETVVTDVEQDRELPQQFAIESVYPNPFNPSTTVNIAARAVGEYQLRVYDVLGRLVREQVVAVQAPGRMQVPLEMSSHPSGLYLVQVEHALTGAVATAAISLVR